jgi:Mg-chelatase subunit ChlD
MACAQPTTAPSGTHVVIEAAFSNLDAPSPDAKDVQTAFEGALKAIATLREQSHIGKTAPSDPAARALACRYELIEAELNRRAGAALPEKDPARQAYLQRAAALYRSLRIVYRELPFAAAGYAGESRVLRDMGSARRADAALDPVILELKSPKLEHFSPIQLRLQRLYWFERLQNAQLREPGSGAALAKQVAAAPVMRDASPDEKHRLDALSGASSPATALGGDSFDPLLAIANASSPPATAAASASLPVAAGGMDDVLRDIRSRGLDVCFVLDATESMDRCIEQSKKRFADVVAIVTKMVGHGDATSSASRIAPIRFGLVAFKDYGDDYGVGATRQLPLTGDTKKLQAALDEVMAGGGGDLPEPIDQALRVATDNRMGWNRRRRNVIILVTDAPVHSTGRDAAFKLASGFAKQAGGEINAIDVGGAPGEKRVRNSVLPDLNRIAENGGGSAFLLADEQAFWRHLIVSMFGQRYESDVQAIVDQYAPQKK